MSYHACVRNLCVRVVLAARSLTHLIDVLPTAGAAVVGFSGAPVLCSKLLSIDYIDLAEQSLTGRQLVNLSFVYHNE